MQYHGFVAYLPLKEATCFLDIFYYFQRLVEAILKILRLFPHLVMQDF